jgi:hypothetical protein
VNSGSVWTTQHDCLKKRKTRKGKEKGREKEKEPRCQWLTPVTLTTQKAEIRRIMVQSQPGK